MSEKDDLFSALASVTKAWKSEKRKADKNDRVRSYVRFHGPPKWTIRDSAFAHMEEAYNLVSSNGRYYANARQIFYKARPLMLPELDKEELDSAYFTQTLLKDYLEGHPETKNWRVVWDARGHFEEPHTGKRIGIGGIEVEKYIDAWTGKIQAAEFDFDHMVATEGPANRFGSVLFIEKEGFNEILQEAEIGERYDMAIMSTKGMPVKACCDLLTQLWSHTEVFVLHDFDKSGFTILKTLREGTRMAQGCDVIDLGFRFEDIGDLPSEPVHESRGGNDVEWRLADDGATEEEIAFLVSRSSDYGWSGERVELNALSTEDFLKWLEKKLQKHHIKKVIPDEDSLETAYRRACLGQKVEAFIREEQERVGDYQIAPKLKNKVKAYLKTHPAASWDSAIWEICRTTSREKG